jgi:hypothetical protein
MNNPEKIYAFLKSNKEMRFCDACMTEKLGLKRPQQASSQPLHLQQEMGFTRGHGICSVCGKTKDQVIRAV